MFLFFSDYENSKKYKNELSSLLLGRSKQKRKEYCATDRKPYPHFQTKQDDNFNPSPSMGGVRIQLLRVNLSSESFWENNFHLKIYASQTSSSFRNVVFNISTNQSVAVVRRLDGQNKIQLDLGLF